MRVVAGCEMSISGGDDHCGVLLRGLIGDSRTSFLGGRCGSTQKRSDIPRKPSVENIPNERSVKWKAVSCLADATLATYDFRVISLFEILSQIPFNVQREIP